MFAENLASFFNPADFAEVATVGGRSVSGIFDRDYFEPLGGDVAGNAPSFVCQSGDAVGIAQGTALTVRATSYVVVGIEPDGTGVTRLRLQEQ